MLSPAAVSAATFRRPFTRSAAELAFAERVKMHSLLMEGLDLVFRDRGLKPLSELTRTP